MKSKSKLGATATAAPAWCRAGGSRTCSTHLPDVLLAKGTHKVLHLGLREMLIVVFYQLGIDGGHCHEDVDTGSLGAQELLPNLGKRHHVCVRIYPDIKSRGK